MGKVLTLWHNLYAIGHVFIVENGQILNTQFGHLVTLLPASMDKNFEKEQKMMHLTLFSAICVEHLWAKFKFYPKYTDSYM